MDDDDDDDDEIECGVRLLVHITCSRYYNDIAILHFYNLKNRYQYIMNRMIMYLRCL